jgi:hypothetical protein
MPTSEEIVTKEFLDGLKLEEEFLSVLKDGDSLTDTKTEDLQQGKKELQRITEKIKAQLVAPHGISAQAPPASAAHSMPMGKQAPSGMPYASPYPGSVYRPHNPFQ